MSSLHFFSFIGVAVVGLRGLFGGTGVAECAFSFSLPLTDGAAGGGGTEGFGGRGSSAFSFLGGLTGTETLGTETAG